MRDDHGRTGPGGGPIPISETSSDRPNPLRRALLGSALMSVALPALAKSDWPSRPINIVVPYSPGTGNDLVARVVGAKMPNYLGGNHVVVQNKAGASGYIATDFVRRAAPDGYTLMLASVSFSVNLYTLNVNYKLADFTPVAMIGEQPFTLVVNAEVPANTVEELVKYMKANPGKLSAGQGGPTGSTFFMLQLFEQTAGVGKLVSAAYSGTYDALMDLQANRIQLLFAPVSTTFAFLKGGKVKALAMTGSQRTEVLPKVPTFKESGFPGLDLSTWFGLLGPKGMPQDAIAALDQAVQKTVSNKADMAPLIAQGVEPGYLPSAKFKPYLEHDLQTWRKLVDDSKLQHK